MRNNLGQRIVFLDRDGVINRDSPAYIKRWQEFEFLPRSLDALALLKQHGFQVMIITNQSAVNRGMIALRDLKRIHSNMKAAVMAGGGLIHDIFFCPHTPQEDCACRKPRPGLVFSARSKHRLLLASAYMVGDHAKDIECAKQAGCGYSLLVKTGNFREAERVLMQKKMQPDFVAEDLQDAAEWIIGHRLNAERMDTLGIE